MKLEGTHNPRTPYEGALGLRASGWMWLCAGICSLFFAGFSLLLPNSPGFLGISGVIFGVGLAICNRLQFQLTHRRFASFISRCGHLLLKCDAIIVPLLCGVVWSLTHGIPLVLATCAAALVVLNVVRKKLWTTNISLDQLVSRWFRLGTLAFLISSLGFALYFKSGSRPLGSNQKVITQSKTEAVGNGVKFSVTDNNPSTYVVDWSDVAEASLPSYTMPYARLTGITYEAFASVFVSFDWHVPPLRSTAIAQIPTLRVGPAEWEIIRTPPGYYIAIPKNNLENIQAMQPLQLQTTGDVPFYLTPSNRSFPSPSVDFKVTRLFGN